MKALTTAYFANLAALTSNERKASRATALTRLTFGDRYLTG